MRVDPLATAVMRHTNRHQHAENNARVLVNELFAKPDWDHVVRFVLHHYTRAELAAAAKQLGAPYAEEREGRRVLIERLRGRYRYLTGSAV